MMALINEHERGRRVGVWVGKLAWNRSRVDRSIHRVS